MKSAESLLGIDANAAVTVCTSLLPVNSPSGCEHKWLSNGLLQLLPRTGARNALDGRRERGQDVSPCKRMSREPHNRVARGSSVNWNGPTRSRPRDGPVSCVQTQGALGMQMSRSCE